MATAKDKAADLRLRRTYGISLADYNRILHWQGGKCAICKRLPKSGRNRLAVDHCHTTGLLRGLLCWHCNRAIGGFRDNLQLIQSAATYLGWPPISELFGLDRFTAPGSVGTKKRAKLLKEFHKGSK